MEDVKIVRLRDLVLKDKEFRELLVKDPAEALKKVNIPATSYNVALVQNVIDSINNFYSGFDEVDEYVT
jgi:hypothetical protein